MRWESLRVSCIMYHVSYSKATYIYKARELFYCHVHVSLPYGTFDTSPTCWYIDMNVFPCCLRCKPYTNKSLQTLKMDTLQIMTNHTTVISFQCYCWQCYLSLVLSEIGRICLVSICSISGELNLCWVWGWGNSQAPEYGKQITKKGCNKMGSNYPPEVLT